MFKQPVTYMNNGKGSDFAQLLCSVQESCQVFL